MLLTTAFSNGCQVAMTDRQRLDTLVAQVAHQLGRSGVCNKLLGVCARVVQDRAVFRNDPVKQIQVWKMMLERLQLPA